MRLEDNPILKRHQRLRMTDEQKAERKRLREEERAREYAAERALYKPCPFCENKDDVWFEPVGSGTDWVRCFACNCTGPTADGKEAAIKKWNDRAMLQINFGRKEDK